MINFEQYHRDNPNIYEMFVKVSKKAKSKGFKHYSAKAVFELIRWYTKEKGNDEFKLNNNYHADYARKMMNDYPNFNGFFRTRDLRAKRA